MENGQAHRNNWQVRIHTHRVNFKRGNSHTLKIQKGEASVGFIARFKEGEKTKVHSDFLEMKRNAGEENRMGQEARK